MELLSKVTRPTSTCDPARRRTYSGRKLPGFTVASDAPLLLSLTSVAHIYDELNTQSVLQWSQAGELGVFFGLLVAFRGLRCYYVSVRDNSAAAGYS